MVVDVERATRIIDALASIDYQAQHDRQSAIEEGDARSQYHKCPFSSK